MDSLSVKDARSMIWVTNETADHYDAVRQLTIDAFAASEFGHCGEADLIDAIRHQCNNAVSFVALEEDRVVGHILFSPATIRCDTKTHYGMALAPLTVLPSHQRQGIGAMLIRHGMRKLAVPDVAFTVVAGHPGYYPRFGFIPAEKMSVTHGFSGMPQDVLFLHTQDLHQRFRDGIVYFHTAFGAQHGG